LAEFAIGSKAGKLAVHLGQSDKDHLEVAIRLPNLADFRAPNGGW